MINGFVKGQSLRLMHPLTVADTVDYLEAKFHFQSSDWQGLAKWAHFKNADAVYDILLVNDKIERTAHLNLTAGDWEIYLHGNGEGGVRITTERQKLRVVPTGLLEGDLLPEVPLGTAEQISAVATSALTVAQSVREDADSGAFDGHTPERGVDYWTESDRVEVVDAAREAVLGVLGEVIETAAVATDDAVAATAEADAATQRADAAAERADAAAKSLDVATDAAVRAETSASAAAESCRGAERSSIDSTAAAELASLYAGAAEKSARSAAASVQGGAYITVFVGEDGCLYRDRTDNLTALDFSLENGNLYLEVIY